MSTYHKQEKELEPTPTASSEAVGRELEASGDHFKQLGWKRLTVILIVEAIALGSLSIPSAFAALGMIAGTISCVGLGLVAIYTSYVVGQTKLKIPSISHYADVGTHLYGRWLYEVIGVMFMLQLTFLVGAHALTGAIAFGHLSDYGTCSVVFGVVSAIILLLLAIPPSFAELAILGYIDFASIVVAIGITIIATGISSHSQEGGMAAVAWSAWPRPGLTFAEAFNAMTNIIFAYSFAVCQFSFMDEMQRPQDYVKSIWALGIIEIIIYTLTGALIYAFVGDSVASPALLSAGPVASKVALGVALPVIFISGSINTTVVCRYIYKRLNNGLSDETITTTKKGKVTWGILITVITIIAFIIAESIPFFSGLLSICSALFISGFTFYFPALMWFRIVKEGPWHSKENLGKAIANGACFLLGAIIFVAGTYAAIADIAEKFHNGKLSSPFACNARW
ncbi:hypothetical protein MCOR27_004086 [Pyricularia oryzae]|uniref:Amino acid transporter transmembrane domain-containing protein n=5 Tax=Pyricularia TaxID=48558 RepID=A0ABQ8NNF3_PYRGI|nr:N amino acid transport system protein [Pyricularia oryzae 70-15]KAH8843589.1 hypothetical protein MCOR01_004383 [Pyricularia oryzae]KAI6299661.1 hypothetical protein MCOR33_004470 [Pyricularia grisea]EHA50681.1 N amino acid transport system protein [Pyricularia oryzae 70-15]KAH9431065.1 hypothetical protein MCOR02_008374 [Pyricularia oryzae]KAI6263575.1 hypothetical protein MCOR19_000212 [Pyricularia oryzae]